MNSSRGKPSAAVTSTRQLARIWSFASIGFLVLVFVGEAVFPSTTAAPTPSEWVGLSLFPGGVCLGMILAWRREGLGGGVTLASLLAFYAWNLEERGKFPGEPYFVLIAAPGLLFLLHWWLAR